jgi:hypothetical protein
MHQSSQIKSLKMGLLATALLVVVGCLLIPSGECQNGASPFGAPRPASVIFEPTMSFIRQNIKLVESYVALLRSIFVGAYDRPLVTSTDVPPTATRGPVPKVPPMDLPANQRTL